MSDNYERQQLLYAKDLISAGEYEEAEEVLNLIKENSTAKTWLERLTALKKEAGTLPDTAPREEQVARKKKVQQIQENERKGNSIGGAGRLSLALLIFLGSLLGSGIGAVADFSEGYDTLQAGYAELMYPRLCIVGSSTILEPGLGLGQAWEKAFEEDHEVRVKIRATGSSAGVEEAINGDCVHVLAMSEPLNEDQYQDLIDAGYQIECAAEIGYDVVVFVTDINNEMDLIQWRELRRIYSGDTTNWLSVQSNNQLNDRPIVVLLRKGSGTTDHVLSKVGLIPIEPFPPETNATYVTCESNEDCLSKSLTIEGSIHGLSAAWISTQQEGFYKVLPILSRDEGGAVSPFDEDGFRLRDYPKVLIRPLYMYVLNGDVGDNDISDEKLRNARSFLSFVRGTEGQKILDNHHFYTYFDRAIFGPDPDEEEYQVALGLELPEGFPVIDSQNVPRACRQ